MERSSKKRNLPFLNAMYAAQEQYALNIKEDEFIELGYKVWRDIGNIAVVTQRLVVAVPDDYVIELPIGCEFISSVTVLDPIVSTYYNSSGAVTDTSDTVQYNPKINESINSTSGQSVNYVLEDNAIRITSVEALNAEILLVYKSILIGDDGLPLLNDKEVAAIAAEVTRRITVRDAFKGVATQKNMLEYITAEAARCMQAATIAEKINDDELDKMLDIKTAWDRKVFGRRFNLMK